MADITRILADLARGEVVKKLLLCSSRICQRRISVAFGISCFSAELLALQVRLASKKMAGSGNRHFSSHGLILPESDLAA
jgi:hypothetical protein